MLSVEVFKSAVIRVGEFIAGYKAWKYKMSTKSDVFLPK